jgi:hypothetical protein
VSINQTAARGFIDEVLDYDQIAQDLHCAR